MERWEIAVVGAGAAGLMAANAAARAQRAQGLPVSVLVLEGSSKPGKKLLATGNGRCNLTNLDVSPLHYHGDTAEAAPLLEAFPPARVLEAFGALGLLCRPDGEGRVYPRSLQAAAVLQALRAGCEERGAALRCGWGVASIARQEGGFLLTGPGGERLWASRCVLACGGKAAPRLSWEGGGYGLARQLGCSLTELRPTLTPLKSPKKCLRSLKGMRARGAASLWVGDKLLRREEGEVLFGEGALSGICVFNLSAYLPESAAALELSLDLLPDMPYREALAYLERQAKAHPARPAWQLFAGALNLRVGEELARELALPREGTLSQLGRQQLRAAASLCKDWRFPVTGPAGWEGAQVTAGGVPLDEVDARTLESRRCPGLYLAGELLNIHGDCGGYNLHWAWATGLAAGEAAAHKRKGKRSC